MIAVNCNSLSRAKGYSRNTANRFHTLSQPAASLTNIRPWIAIKSQGLSSDREEDKDPTVVSQPQQRIFRRRPLTSTGSETVTSSLVLVVGVCAPVSPIWGSRGFWQCRSPNLVFTVGCCERLQVWRVWGSLVTVGVKKGKTSVVDLEDLFELVGGRQLPIKTKSSFSRDPMLCRWHAATLTVLKKKAAISRRDGLLKTLCPSISL